MVPVEVRFYFVRFQIRASIWKEMVNQCTIQRGFLKFRTGDDSFQYETDGKILGINEGRSKGIMRNPSNQLLNRTLCNRRRDKYQFNICERNRKPTSRRTWFRKVRTIDESFLNEARGKPVSVINGDRLKQIVEENHADRTGFFERRTIVKKSYWEAFNIYEDLIFNIYYKQ